MRIYTRRDGGVYWVSFQSPNGGTVRQSTWTKDHKEAQEYADKLKAESWRVRKLGEATRHTWNEAVVKWVEERADKKSIECDKSNFRLLHNRLNNKPLDNINKALIDCFVSDRRKDGVSNATINRSLALLRSVLNAAVNEWEWLKSAPKIRLLREPKHRVRYLDGYEITRLIDELPGHLKLLVRFALATGLRDSNLVGLRWENVDIPRACAWVKADESKSGKAIAIPLNSDAMAVIRECELMRAVVGIHVKHVFTYRGKPVTRANNHAWRKALKRAGIDDFRFHDLRHTWATRHIMAGTPIEVLRELGGWATIDMVLKYAHFSGERLAEYASNIDAPCTKNAQAQKRPV